MDAQLGVQGWTPPDLSLFRGDAYRGDSGDRVDLIEGRLPIGCLVLVAGEGGTGKSMLALQTAEAIASGAEDAFGGKVNPDYRGSRVLAVFGEDRRASIDRRLNQTIRPEQGGEASAAAVYIAAPDTADGMVLVELDYNRNVRPTAAFEWLESQIRDGGYSLVVIDTLSVLMPIDVNNASEVTSALSLLNGIAARYGCVVMLTHHMNKASMQGGSRREKIRGSTALVDTSRASYTLTVLDGKVLAEKFEGLALAEGEDIVELALVKDNEGLSRARVYYLRESTGYMRYATVAARAGISAEDALLQLVRNLNEHSIKVTKRGSGDSLVKRRNEMVTKGFCPSSLSAIGQNRLGEMAEMMVKGGRLSYSLDKGYWALSRYD